MGQEVQENNYFQVGRRLNNFEGSLTEVESPATVKRARNRTPLLESSKSLSRIRWQRDYEAIHNNFRADLPHVQKFAEPASACKALNTRESSKLLALSNQLPAPPTINLDRKISKTKKL